MELTERKNRTIMELARSMLIENRMLARSMLIEKEMPKKFSEELKNVFLLAIVRAQNMKMG